MIGRLHGRVIAEESDGALVVDVGGVGYELMAPLGTLGRAARDAEDRVTLFVHTHAREDALLLYGFATDADRTAFRTLIGVSSVGPKTAVAVLSALPAHELARAVMHKELGKLTAISGIGKKTAERLLLELKDKIAIAPDATAANGAAPRRAPPLADNASLLAKALTNMGYKPLEADRAIAELEGELEGAELGALVKRALAVLAR